LRVFCCALAPSLYRPEFAEQARKLCLLGATDKELADFWGVSVQTNYDWQKAHPEYLESITRGKYKADAEDASKLFERACGSEQGADKFYRGDDGSVIKVPNKVEYPPDTQAASLWLRNRQPHRWRDRHQVDVADNRADILDDLTEEQLVERVMQRREAARRRSY
jgi:hypothetical protein